MVLLHEFPCDAPDVGQTWRPEGDVGVGREHEVVVAGAKVAGDVVVEGFGASQIVCSLSGGHKQGARDAGNDVIVVGRVLVTIGVAVDLLLLVWRIISSWGADVLVGVVGGVFSVCCYLVLCPVHVLNLCYID